MSNHITPQDILSDSADTAIFNGQPVRKGTVAAFFANIDILENLNATVDEKNQALNMIKTLSTSILAIGLHKHVVFKNPQVAQFFEEQN